MSKKKLGGFLAGLASVLAVVYGTKGGHHDPAPWPTPAILAEWTATCRAVVAEQTTREIADSELSECIGRAKAGAQAEDLRVWADALPKPVPPPAPEPEPIRLQRLHADGRIFRAEDGQPWRWRGVSSFALLNRFAKGEDITDTLTAYQGFNILRVWPYVPAKDWGARAWDTPDVETIRRFVAFVNARGFYVELTLLTDDDPARLAWAKTLVPQLDCSAGLLLEGGNEPTTHKHIDTPALRSVLAASGCLYASGDYEDSGRAYGAYLVAHPGRDADWPRRAHDLLEYWTGGGPNAPTDPAHHVPIVADEPAKLQDVGGNREQDWLAFFAACSLLGGGATFHSETGKLGLPPTPDEAVLAAAALRGLTAFPADAPLGPYSRPDEGAATLRTYKVGPYTVRIRPTDGVVIR